MGKSRARPASLLDRSNVFTSGFHLLGGRKRDLAHGSLTRDRVYVYLVPRCSLLDLVSSF